MNKKKVSVILFPYVFYVNNKISRKKRKVVSKEAEQILVYVLRFYFRFLYFCQFYY